MAFTLGIDYGTNSVRALFVDVSGGRGLQEKWKSNLAAQCWLWKDHTNYREAARITEAAAQHRPQFIAKVDLSGVMKELIHIKEAQTR